MICERPLIVSGFCKRSLWFLLLLAGTMANAQTDFVTGTHERKDTNLINTYINRAERLQGLPADSSLYYLNQALVKSYAADYSKGIINALTEMAALHFGNDAKLSIRYCNMALAELNGRHYADSEHVSYRIYSILAQAYETKGMIDSSAHYYYLLNDALEEGKLAPGPRSALVLYTQLAMFWLNSNWDINGGYIEPTQYFINKAQRIEQASPDSTHEMSYISYMLQGAYYNCIGKYDSSRYFLLEYLRLREKHKLQNISWDAASYLNIAESYLLQNRVEEGLPYIQRVLSMKDTLASKTRYLVLANLYLARAFYIQRKYAQSITTFHDTWKHFNKNDFLDKELIYAYKVTADSYEALGQMPQALEYKNVYIRLHDSLMRKDKLDMMNRLQIKYRIAEKDKALAEQKLATAVAENRARQKNGWIAGVSFLALFISVLFVLWQRSNKQKQYLQQEKINSFQQQMEIAKLNATIAGEERERTRIARELHDGIGGLMAGARMNFEMIRKVHGLEKERDFKDGLKLLEDASSELRKTAHNMMPEMLLQEGLVVAVEYFCQKVAGNSPTRIYCQTSGDARSFHPNFELTIYRVIQELVHNIMKHAKATQAIVQIGFSDHIFDVTVEDNGVGMPPGVMEQSKGIGLKSIADRIKSIGGKMEVHAEPGSGTSIYIEVALKKENPALSQAS